MRKRHSGRSTSRKATALVILMQALLVGVTGSGHGDDGALDSPGTGYDLSWHTIDGGGVMFSVGDNYELSGTIGQPDAGGPMYGGDYELIGGFWFALASGDCNTDGGVNLFDYDALETCMNGPAGGALSQECACYDLDRNGTVDLVDFAAFQSEFSGS